MNVADRCIQLTAQVKGLLKADEAVCPELANVPEQGDPQRVTLVRKCHCSALPGCTGIMTNEALTDVFAALPLRRLTSEITGEP